MHYSTDYDPLIFEKNNDTSNSHLVPKDVKATV